MGANGVELQLYCFVRQHFNSVKWCIDNQSTLLIILGYYMQLCQILLRKNAEDYDPKDLKRTMEPRLRQMHLKTIDKQAFLFFL